MSKYICPMHPEVESDNPGVCSKCNMQLTQAGTEHAEHHNHTPKQDTKASLRKMAASATLHCLTGCAIGEVAGLIIGTTLGLGNTATVALAIVLAFIFGFTLSTLPLRKAGLGFFAALSIVFAADTLSIATMEVVDNAVMLVIPGAMAAGILEPLFWISMAIALAVAYCVAYPVNLYLLKKGKGHALVMKYHTKHNH